jgi:general transcriptional corepressor CYC8
MLNIDGSNGETWAALGHCYLMLDDIGKAFNAYQQALQHMPNAQVIIHSWSSLLGT